MCAGAVASKYDAALVDMAGWLMDIKGIPTAVNLSLRQHWLHGTGSVQDNHMVVVCPGGMLPEQQVQVDTISPAEEVLLDSWLPALQDNSAAGKTCPNNTACMICCSPSLPA